MAADKKTAFLGNMANQRRDIVAIMARMGDVIKSPQASYETRRWKEPQPLGRSFLSIPLALSLSLSLTCERRSVGAAACGTS